MKQSRYKKKTQQQPTELLKGAFKNIWKTMRI